MSTATWVAATAIALGAMAPADTPGDLPEPTAGQLEAAVQHWSDSSIEASVQQWSVDDSVSGLIEESTEGSDTVLTLSSDILFDFGRATIGDSARTVVEEALADVPKKAEVAVDGHTDSVGSTSDNRRLSEQRAQAVAKVIRDDRSDLTLTVKGHGESDPVAENSTDGKDNPEGRQRNRRVEISHEG